MKGVEEKVVVMVVGGAPDDLALLDDAAQLSQHGLPHVNCAHASRLRLGSRGKHA